MLAGDNAKHPEWGSRVINPAGRKLLQGADRNGYEVLGPDSPTHIPTSTRASADVLDILVKNNIRCPVQIEVVYDLDTQHLPILITLALSANFTAPRPTGVKTDWAAYTSALMSIDVGHLTTPAEVENEVVRFLEAIQKAKVEASTPIAARRPQARDQLPLHIKQDLKEKRTLRREWARSRCPRLKSALNKLSAEVSEAVRTWRGETWDQTIDRASENDSSLYALNRALTRAPLPTYPRDRNGVRRFAPTDRAEILVAHLGQQFTPHSVPDDVPPEVVDHHTQVEEAVVEFLSRPAPTLGGDEFMYPAEVRKAILRLHGRNRRRAATG
ncbi:putative endonuclease and reverse transcriptase-like protein [Operophtera brumata]|uniref:Putative endonuclease and reverse transcriptase-like protein n=1 Tax=Operophtera brumata TaxID=104452 RepID=A0A0L7LR03_OPEBR|nr:putative endonuclease and reverse transcriptase-like protein [Operophtera brumata]